MQPRSSENSSPTLQSLLDMTALSFWSPSSLHHVVSPGRSHSSPWWAFSLTLTLSASIPRPVPTCECAKLLPSCPTLCDPMDCSCQAPLFMGFSRQEYCSGLPCPPPGDLPDSGIKPESLTSSALAHGFFIISATWEAHPHVVPLNQNLLKEQLNAWMNE